ncbi:transcriptional regulator LysR family [Bacillus paralicheniformis]|nr:transcriptional regulator LysR family [Bacillus paralicheniformis]
MTEEISIVYRKNKHICAASRVFMELLISSVKNETADAPPR